MSDAGDKKHDGLPVKGYQPQPQWKVDLVNHHKRLEEITLRQIESITQMFAEGGEEFPGEAARWVAIAKTHFQEGWMAANRAVFLPTRVEIQEDRDGDMK